MTTRESIAHRGVVYEAELAVNTPSEGVVSTLRTGLLSSRNSTLRITPSTSMAVARRFAHAVQPPPVELTTPSHTRAWFSPLRLKIAPLSGGTSASTHATTGT